MPPAESSPPEYQLSNSSVKVEVESVNTKGMEFPDPSSQVVTPSVKIIWSFEKTNLIYLSSGNHDSTLTFKLKSVN